MALPATFNDFLGNATAVEHLRTAIAAGRLPHSLLLSGPAGAGKYTLALMLAMAVECEPPAPRPLVQRSVPWPPSAESATTAPASPPPPTSTNR